MAERRKISRTSGRTISGLALDIDSPAIVGILYLNPNLCYRSLGCGEQGGYLTRAEDEDCTVTRAGGQPETVLDVSGTLNVDRMHL